MTFTLARTRVRVARTGQRVRMGPVTVTPPATASDVFNLTNRFGDYARVTLKNGDLRFAYSHFPTPPFEFESQVTFNGQASAGRFAWTARRSIVLLYQNGFSIEELRSDDDGLTWVDLGVPTSLLGSASTPDVSTARDGTLLRAWQKTSTLRIQSTLQAPGDASAGAATDVSLPASGPVAFIGDSFRFVWDLKGWLWLHARPQGATSTRLYVSYDQGASFAVSPTTTTGIASGTHPGMAIGHEGTLWAWAFVSPNIQFMRRAPGDTDWSAATIVKDNAGANLSVADAASSFALAYEGTARLVLATTKAGESQVSDWFSGDDGSSLTRFT